MSKQSIFLEASDIHGLEVNGWSAVDETGMSSALVWYKNNDQENQCLIYATPQYNEENEVPFEYRDGGLTKDEVHYYPSLRFNKFQSKADQKMQYLAVITFIIDKVVEGNGIPDDQAIGNHIEGINKKNYAALNMRIEKFDEESKKDNVQLSVDEVFLSYLKQFAEASDGLMNAIDQLGEEEFTRLSRKYPFEKKFEKVNKKIQRWFVRSWEL